LEFLNILIEDILKLLRFFVLLIKECPVAIQATLRFFLNENQLKKYLVKKI